MPSGFPPGTFGTPPNATSNARTGSSGERGAQSANDSQSSSSTAAASSPPVAAIVISVIAVLTVIGGVGGYFGYKKFYPQQRSKIVSNLEAATAERAGGGDSVDPNMPQLTESAYAIGGGDGMGGEGMMMDEDALNIDMECVADYVPNLDDELALKVGDIITVTEIFEDGK